MEAPKPNMGASERASSIVFSFSCTRPSVRPSVRRRSEGVKSSDHRVNLREQLPRRGRRGKAALVLFLANCFSEKHENFVIFREFFAFFLN